MHLTAHFALSYLLPWRVALERRERAVVAFAGIAPDIDAPILLLMGKEAFVEYHHDWTHHLAGAILAAGAGYLLGKRRAVTAAFAAAAWCGHVLLDMLGGGDRHPGEPFAYPVPLLWPFSDRPFDPFPFSWPLASWQNGVVMAAAIALMFRLALVEGRTVVEVFSLKVDRAVVDAIRRRFGPRFGRETTAPPPSVP